MGREVMKTTATALTALLEKCKTQIAAALPKHLTPERMMRMATTVFSRTPALQKCEVTSIIGCVIQASELGLELSGPLGEAYMVPRWNGHTKQMEATFQVGYRGFFQLAFRSDKLLKMPMRTVYAGDDFAIDYGTQDKIIHRPNLGPERGQPVGCYTCAFMVGGIVEFEFISVDELNAHRDRYVQKDQHGKIPDYSPWMTSEEAMRWKTPARRLCKRLPVSTEMLRRAVSVDECEEQGILAHRPQLGLTRTDVVGAKIGVGQDDAPEDQQGDEGPADAPPTKKAGAKVLGQIRGHLDRLGMLEDGMDLHTMSAEQAEAFLAVLDAKPTPHQAREPGDET